MTQKKVKAPDSNQHLAMMSQHISLLSSMLGIKYGKGDYKNKDSDFVKNYEAFIKTHDKGFDKKEHKKILDEINELQKSAAKEYEKSGHLRETLEKIENHIVRYRTEIKANRDANADIDHAHMNSIMEAINARRTVAISEAATNTPNVIHKKPPPCRKVPEEIQIRVGKALSWYGKAKHALLEVEHYHIANNTAKGGGSPDSNLFLTLENARDRFVQQLAHDAHVKRSLKPKKPKKPKKPRKPKTAAPQGEPGDSEILLAPHPETQLTARAFPEF
jgi:hypothetical protein